MSKPDLCPKCHIRPAIDLANKGIYDRNLSNWEWLCRKCHMESDGRLDNFIKGPIGRIPWNKGKTWSDDVKQRISDSLTGSEGRPHSLETKQRMSEIRREYWRKKHEQ